MAVGIDVAGVRVTDFVTELDLTAARRPQARDNLHGIAEADGVAVAALQVGNGDVVAGAGDLSIGHSGRRHPDNAPGLKPYDLFAVVDAWTPPI